MLIELRPIGDIRPYENNPRLNDDAVAAVAESIRQFGFRQPIVVDEQGVIIVGHTRWKAAQKLGLEKVPVHVAKDLSPEQIKAYRIADNKTAELAEWNYDLLPIELSELQGMDFDLGLLGFSEDELAKLLDPGVKQGLTDPDEVPEPPDEPITKPGDLWVLGDHRLLCGNSGNPEHVDRLLAGAKIHLVNTDPPYNVRVEPRSNNAIAAGLSSFQGTKHHQRFDVERHPEKANATHRKMRAKDRPLENDFVSDEAFDQMLRAWFGNIARVLQPGRGFYIWGGYANPGRNRQIELWLLHRSPRTLCRTGSQNRYDHRFPTALREADPLPVGSTAVRDGHFPILPWGEVNPPEAVPRAPHACPSAGCGIWGQAGRPSRARRIRHAHAECLLGRRRGGYCSGGRHMGERGRSRAVPGGEEPVPF